MKMTPDSVVVIIPKLELKHFLGLSAKAPALGAVSPLRSPAPLQSMHADSMTGRGAVRAL